MVSGLETSASHFCSFAYESEMAGMKISRSRSEAMVLRWKRVDYPPILLTRNGKLEQEMVR